MSKRLMKSMDEMIRSDPGLRDLKTIKDRLGPIEDPVAVFSAQMFLVVRDAMRRMRACQEEGRPCIDLESMSADDICDLWLSWSNRKGTGQSGVRSAK